MTERAKRSTPPARHAPEADDGGDCYEAALVLMISVPPEDRPRWRLCHGEPIGQGPIAGIRHGHAWCEEQRPFHVVVHDLSNGKTIRGWPRELYYAVGRIEPDEVARYTHAEAAQHALETGHCGPWEDE